MTELRGIDEILAIRFARLGDVALLLPALARLKALFPDARLSLMTGSRCAPLARLCPYLDEVHSVDRLALRDGPKLRALGDIRRLVRDVRASGFDLVVDFHSFRETNLLSWASGARYRMGMKRSDRAYLPFCFNLPPAPEDKGIHVAEMFKRVVDNLPGSGAGAPLSLPLLEIPSEVRSRVEGLVGKAPSKMVLYVGASVIDRRWPSAGFAALADHAMASWGAAVLILAGTSEAEERIAEETRQLVRDRESVRILTGLSIAELAGTIASANLMISNDTGPMHIGSALGVPTLGIFSLSLPLHYCPVGSRDRYIRKDSVEDVEIGEVIEVAEQMWATAGPDRRP